MFSLDINKQNAVFGSQIIRDRMRYQSEEREGVRRRELPFAASPYFHQENGAFFRNIKNNI